MKTINKIDNLDNKLPIEKSKRDLFFDEVITFRGSTDIKKVMDFWINNPKCIDEINHKPLFDNRSHFIKTAILELFSKLREKYKDYPIL